MAAPPWVPTAETKPAPMPLLLVQSFVNTWEGDAETDLLGEPASARAWLSDAGLLSGHGHLGDDDLALAAAGTREHSGAPRSQWRRAGPSVEGHQSAEPARPRESLADSGRDVGSDRAATRKRSSSDRTRQTPSDHSGRAVRRQLEAFEGLPQLRLPLGFLRPVPRWKGSVVRHGRLRQSN